MRTFLIIFSCLLCGSCAIASPTKTIRTFSRSGARQPSITVVLRWHPNPDPQFYTPRGSMREVTITEAGHSVSVPPTLMRTIQDLWPERVTLQSPRPGDYDLSLPYGVGQGSLTLVRVRAFRVVSVTDVPTG